MKVSALSSAELNSALKLGGIFLHTSPFILHLRSDVPAVATGVQRLYADYNLDADKQFADFYVEISTPKSLRRWIRPQANFIFDGYSPFTPLSLEHSFPFFEWGVNWCIANNSHQYLVFHAAAVEKGGRVVIMPGVPGAGKSTLCAALVCRGWRLLTDELTLISLEDNTVMPVPRPIGLKNESIDVIKAFEPTAVFGESSPGTSKGTVAHMKAPTDSVARSKERAEPALVLFPKYIADAKTQLESESKSRAFMRLIEYSFNYNVLGAEAFHVMGKLMDACDCYDFSYSKLDEAVEVFDALCA